MYIPLKVTTEYSILKSLIKVPALMNFLCEQNINACGICDENLYGVLDFYNNCKINGIKPIIGLDVIINGMHLYLYAKNYQGYKNILKINTIKEQRELGIVDLEKYKNNLIVIVPFASKELFYNLGFFDYIYIGYSNLYEKNNALVITKNALFISEIKALKIEDLKYLEYLDMLRKEESKDYSNNYYKIEECIDYDKQNEVVNLIDIKMPEGQRYIPKYRLDGSSDSFLRALALKGLSKRLNNQVTDVYLKRLNHELDVISKMGFVDYFLIVYDYVLYAKKQGIFVGPGRGSAAGSLVSFAIGITDIDPLKYDLLFERFLNPARVTMPDIDIDFDATRRGEVIEYVKNKYGKNNVALGLTFNTLKSKLVLREVGKVLGVNVDLIDKFVKNIDAKGSLRDNLSNLNVKKYLTNYKELKKVYEVSLHLEGLKRNVSTHAAGVVVSSVALDEVIPVHFENDNLITGVAMDYLENIGLLKMDFLSVKNLTTIANIKKYIGTDVLKNIDLEDRDVYALFKSGKTDGIFQFETPMMKSLVMQLKPNCFSDLVAGVALGRPGPKEHAGDFIKRKEGLEKVEYLHPDLASILKETYGILIYQEQIIAILVKIAGYTYQEADLIRRAISKKKENVLKDEENKFINKAINNNYSKEDAKKIYDLIAKFASYGFNKSHSVAYALISYQMAYLKVHYPAYFLVELLNSGNSDKTNHYLAYLKFKGIKVYKPDINNSYNDYYISDNKLYMPLKLIKNISSEIAGKIILAKEDQYLDLFDFCYKTKEFMTKGLLENLIKAGALDSLELNHQTLINNIDSALNYGALQDDLGLIEKPLIVEHPEYSAEELRENEIESYGFYVTNHPASTYKRSDHLSLMNLEKYLFKKIKCIVLVERIRSIKTKKGEDMAFLSGSDDTGVADFTVFPIKFKMLDGINEGMVVEIFGEVSKRFDKCSIIVENIRKVG